MVVTSAASMGSSVSAARQDVGAALKIVPSRGYQSGRRVKPPYTPSGTSLRSAYRHLPWSQASSAPSPKPKLVTPPQAAPKRAPIVSGRLDPSAGFRFASTGPGSQIGVQVSDEPASARARPASKAD